ncbi:DUF2622 domain-containing protein [Atlantibacter hermannii]|uniref:DUF2622 domain-containing protein n=1 Tax=Atlantibacter hermannii TaxID=565 RepID=UPI0028A81EF0|nr:DUF2622 domain-containing protein [Atlantibacter hermannii]MCQ4969157.1 DUF2622 domain-containing protein [Enterobacteriaceae bacterium DFI.7.85]
MAKFTVRVELHGAGDSHYDALYEAMAAEGFTKTITSVSGVVYDLPHGEYNYSSEESVGEVRTKVSAIADKIISNSVLVTRSSGRSWVGLDETDEE